MNIENISVDKLIPYENNPKIHSDEQIARIANSIKEFGFQQPLVIDKDNVVVIGHGRLLAAKELGIEEVPCVRANELNPQQIRALRLVDNRVNDSEWDFSNVQIELDDILDIDMAQFGFDLTIHDEYTDEITDDFFADKENIEKDTKKKQIDTEKVEEGKECECPFCGKKFYL